MKCSMHGDHDSSATPALTGVGCFALGAAVMYLLDPERGTRRRHLLRDKFFSSIYETGECLAKTAEYTRDRTRGIIAETTKRFRADEAPDVVIVERVRSAMGRAVSHPHAIQAFAQDGVVTLRGPILGDELDTLLSTLSRVRGVRGVNNQLELHTHPGNIPALQGGGSTRHGQRYDLMQAHWSPFTRLWTGLAGSGLAVWGLGQRGLIGAAAGLFGSSLMLRSLTNLEARRLTGIGAGRRAVEVQKTININAPVGQVFGFFSCYENFPHFMSNVREVRDPGSGCSHWCVAGPMGINVEWDADLTNYIPNRIIAWRSVEGSTVENAGVIRFQENLDSSTRVDIKLSYNPPGGALGHILAKLFGADPKSEMDADLARVKTTLETCHPPRDAAQPLSAAHALH